MIEPPLGSPSVAAASASPRPSLSPTPSFSRSPVAPPKPTPAWTPCDYTLADYEGGCDSDFLTGVLICRESRAAANRPVVRHR
ncbi:hypothetical protein GCM10023176_62820 [Micromonospora coerulea]|uniref:Uncharacterized protein n=1 Tax=Micromonospora coerulea TaxID=47856 RepID=A0ABP8T7Q0_9ACTN